MEGPCRKGVQWVLSLNPDVSLVLTLSRRTPITLARCRTPPALCCFTDLPESEPRSVSSPLVGINPPSPLPLASPLMFILTGQLMYPWRASWGISALQIRHLSSGEQLPSGNGLAHFRLSDDGAEADSVSSACLELDTRLLVHRSFMSGVIARSFANHGPLARRESD